MPRPQYDTQANCRDLLPQVYDKYFRCNPFREKLLAQVAQAICRNCVLLDDCLDYELREPERFDIGVVAGHSANSVYRAHLWIEYEAGHRTDEPSKPRPRWLPVAESQDAVAAQQAVDRAS